MGASTSSSAAAKRTYCPIAGLILEAERWNGFARIAAVGAADMAHLFHFAQMGDGALTHTVGGCVDIRQLQRPHQDVAAQHFVREVVEHEQPAAKTRSADFESERKLEKASVRYGQVWPPTS